MPRKRIVRLAVQALVLFMVVWGIVHSGRKAASQLTRQRQELVSRANLIEQQALQSTDTQARERLLIQAGTLRRSVDHFWQVSPLLLVAAGVCYALGMLPANWYWRQCLLTMDQRAPWLETSWAYFYGNLGKYFPGKAMVIVLRLSALKEYGFKKMVTAITIIMETLTMMAVGGALASLCLILLDIDWRLTLLSAGLLLGMFLPTLPAVLRRLIALLQKGVSAHTLQTWTSRIHAGLILKGWAAMTITWLFFGLSLLCILRGLSITDAVETDWSRLLLSSLGACGLAVVLGFVSLLPGGAGVREVVLSTILAPVVGPTAALCAAVWLRITWLATELAVVAMLACLRFVQRRYLPTKIA